MGRCLFVTRPINGVDAHFILDENGNERQINFSLDTDRFCNDRCPFNVQEWNGPEVYIGEYYGEYCDIAPGKWGIIDSKGDIVVAPQYVFAIGFYYGDGNHSAVARLKEGKLAWGVIDISGKETIPCQYSELYIPVDGYVVYRSEGSRLWGLMDYDGNVLADPQFEYIEGYDPEHRLITVGEDDETLGVYSLEQKRMIIPAEYDCIDYSESFIDCEIQYTARSRLFDYSGNEIFFQDYDSVYDSKGNLNVWKDGKAGIIDKNGQVIIPPVLRNGLDVNAEYYMKGYMITGTKRAYGLSSTDGRTIIPEIYTDIYFHGDFIVASEQTDGNWHLRDSLYTIDGKLLLSGIQRNIEFNEENDALSMETPLGILYYKILNKQ